MSEQHYVRKALEEVIRLADEKTGSVEDIIVKREEELRDTAKSCDDTITDVEEYFTNLSKQLDRWKGRFIQDIQKCTNDIQDEYQTLAGRAQKSAETLHQHREAAAQILTSGQYSNSELIYQMHSCIFAVNQDVDYLSEFVSNCNPMKFIGCLDFEALQRSQLGTLENLSDNLLAEILPSKLPKIKLGQLFHLEFRISKKYCEAVKKFLTYVVTKDDDQTKVCAYLQDNRNGTYSLSFPITVIVPHTISVWYLGEHIRNSPYTIVFKVGPAQAVAGMAMNPATKVVPNDSKEEAIEAHATKPNARGTGDDKDLHRRTKWINQSENAQKNNNR